MVQKRSLPKQHNPLVEPEHTPPVEILVERRRLGQTNLSVKPGQVGTSNATKSENLGLFDYAHLRVPLPRDLSGSGVFTLHKSSTYPETYFLMRRSNDGYISATGMFKAAYPWASQKDEEIERKYLKSLGTTSQEEVAGNVWIPPNSALDIAEDYGMRTWIEALLDPEPVEPSTTREHHIASPPRYEQAMSKMTSRSRSLRSASPTKIATPARKIASPRKRLSKKDRDASKGDGAGGGAPSAGSSAALNRALANGNTLNATPETDDSVAVENDYAVQSERQVKQELTAVKSERSASGRQQLQSPTKSSHKQQTPASPEMPVLQTTEAMVAKARKMVDEANKFTHKAAAGSISGRGASKRKASEYEDDPDYNDEGAGTAGGAGGQDGQPVAKKARLLEEQLKKEKVKARALIGLTATIAIGALAPYIL